VGPNSIFGTTFTYVSSGTKTRLVSTTSLRWESQMPHRKYRELERECHLQAAITGHKETRAEFEKMEREYKALADWLEARQRTHQKSPCKE